MNKNTFENQNISIAIPTYNSSKYLEQLLSSSLKNEIVTEVVISDDASNVQEKEIYLKTVEKFQKKYPDKKIKFVNNFERRGPFVNKYIAIENCSKEIVYQIDSDNIPMRNLDKFIKYDLLKLFNEDSLYLPSKIYQFYQKPYLSIPLSKVHNGTKYRVIFQDKNFRFDKDLIKKSILNEVKITKQKNSRWLINIGNFIVYKPNFLSTMKEGLSFSERLLFAANQFLISYLWLKNNNYIETRRQHYHFHRKRRDSISFQEKENTEESFKTIEEKILEL